MGFVAEGARVVTDTFRSIDLVVGALRRKLLTEGAESLSITEWHLLRVSHFLSAIGDGTLERLLADTPQAELVAIADGLDAINAPQAAASLRLATEAVVSANEPGRGLRRAKTVETVARDLTTRMTWMRVGIEQRLQEYSLH